METEHIHTPQTMINHSPATLTFDPLELYGAVKSLFVSNVVRLASIVVELLIQTKDKQMDPAAACAPRNYITNVRIRQRL